MGPLELNLIKIGVIIYTGKSNRNRTDANKKSNILFNTKYNFSLQFVIVNNRSV